MFGFIGLFDLIFGCCVWGCRKIRNLEFVTWLFWLAWVFEFACLVVYFCFGLVGVGFECLLFGLGLRCFAATLAFWFELRLGSFRITVGFALRWVWVVASLWLLAALVCAVWVLVCVGFGLVVLVGLRFVWLCSLVGVSHFCSYSLGLFGWS